MKVIFHIDETKKWNLTLNNVKNFLNTYDGEVSIIVLANGDAVKGYLNDSVLDEFLNRLGDRDVVFKACKRSLKANNIEEDSIFNVVEIVPTGVVELALRQEEGFSYIKP